MTLHGTVGDDLVVYVRGAGPDAYLTLKLDERLSLFLFGRAENNVRLARQWAAALTTAADELEQRMHPKEVPDVE
jgi:hypothetical protein